MDASSTNNIDVKVQADTKEQFRNPAFARMGSFKERTHALSGQNWEPTWLWS